ncbi:TPA: DUF551 domain-containing protein [Klebsiella pneumoniae]|nr:DUF551 domain-containing protein [Klebsiella pneumoniae]HDK6205880.1 DUF551 domain-containing protein [Klebsiella pneumoniae]
MTKSTITRDQLRALAVKKVESLKFAITQSAFTNIRRGLEEELQLAEFALAAMDSEPVEMPLDYLQGHKDGLEWASQLAEANHPETGDWLYDDPIELAKAIRKGPDMPPAQPVADSEPVIVVGDDGGDALSYRRLIQSFEPGTKLYRHAQPVPVVPKEMTAGIAVKYWEGGRGSIESFVAGYNFCRATMLQASPFCTCPSGDGSLRWPCPAHPGNSPAQSDCCPAQNHVSPEQNGDTPAQSQGWIQVSEQMPPSRHEVLVGRWWGEKPRWCCKWATYIPGHPDAQSSGWLIPGASWTPTHWMPLPAAPQEVKSE